MEHRYYLRPGLWVTAGMAAIWLLLCLADAQWQPQQWWGQLWRSPELVLLPSLLLFWGLTLGFRPR